MLTGAGYYNINKTTIVVNLLGRYPLPVFENTVIIKAVKRSITWLGDRRPCTRNFWPCFVVYNADNER